MRNTLLANDAPGSTRSLLDKMVCDGARRLLSAALEAEVAAYVASSPAAQRERPRLMVRNEDHVQREVFTRGGVR